MAQSQKMALSEIQLLHREIEAQGEWLNREKLDRKIETDRLRMELEALKRVISTLHPEFASAFRTEMEDVRLNYDPES